MAAKGLNYRQERFIQEYLACGNASEAARRAGYSPASAATNSSILMQNPKIIRAIEDAREELRERHWLTMEYVLDGLREVAERAMQKKPVMTFDQGERKMVQLTNEEGQGVWQFDSQGANRALELLGKTMGAFTDKLSVKDETLDALHQFLTGDGLE